MYSVICSLHLTVISWGAVDSSCCEPTVLTTMPSGTSWWCTGKLLTHSSWSQVPATQSHQSWVLCRVHSCCCTDVTLIAAAYTQALVRLPKCCPSLKMWIIFCVHLKMLPLFKLHSHLRSKKLLTFMVWCSLISFSGLAGKLRWLTQVVVLCTQELSWYKCGYQNMSHFKKQMFAQSKRIVIRATNRNFASRPVVLIENGWPFFVETAILSYPNLGNLVFVPRELQKRMRYCGVYTPHTGVWVRVLARPQPCGVSAKQMRPLLLDQRRTWVVLLFLKIWTAMDFVVSNKHCILKQVTRNWNTSIYQVFRRMNVNVFLSARKPHMYVEAI